MIDLREHQGPLERFLQSSLLQFVEARTPGNIGHIALYSCPWAGWVSLCIDPEPQAEQNCPDFKYVEVAIYAANDWSTEYENMDTPRVIDLAGNQHVIDVEAEGDEAFNRVFLVFLLTLMTSESVEPLLRKYTELPALAGVQMLDSILNRTWNLHES